MLNNNANAYRDAVEALQPGAGAAGQLVQAIYLCKAAYHILILNDPDDNLPEDVVRRAANPHPISINWGPQFAERFSKEEARLLWQRCAALDATLQADEEHFVPGFQARPMHYFFETMSSQFSAEDFIASWAASA